jgi:hypothetical protein
MSWRWFVRGPCGSWGRSVHSKLSRTSPKGPKRSCDPSRITLPLGSVDASVIAVAERLAIQEVATLDRRHFSVVRPLHVAALTLLPA